MPRRGENIFKRKDGRWEGRYIKGYQGTRAVYGYVYDKTYAGVKQKLDTAKAGVKGIKQLTEPRKMNCGQWFEYWLENYVRLKVKESTYIKYHKDITKHINPAMGTVKLTEVTAGHIQQALDELGLHGKGAEEGGLAANTLSGIYQIIKAALTKSNELGYTSLQFGKPRFTKSKQAKIRAFSREEQKQLEQHIAGSDEYILSGVVICLYTGMRIGELCALKWEDVDFSRHVIHIRATLQRIQNLEEGAGRKTKIVESPAKTDSSMRDIVMAEFLSAYLEGMRRSRPFAHCEYVLCNKNGSFLEPRTLQYRFQGVLKRLGIKDATFHTLRHTFATRCLELGFDIKTLSELMGHSNPMITMQRYVHSLEEQKRLQMESLQAIFRMSL